MCHGQLLSESLSKARKPHKCSVCGKEIATGTVYYRQASVSSDGFGKWKAHERCAALDWATRGDDACSWGDPKDAIADSAHANWRWLRAEARRQLAVIRSRFAKPKERVA